VDLLVYLRPEKSLQTLFAILLHSTSKRVTFWVTGHSHTQTKEHRELIKKQKEKETLKREYDYIQLLNDDLNQEEKRILKLQRQQLISIETATLLERQNLIRTREAAVWELEHRQMDSKYNQMRKHVRDFFYLQRHLMLTKQEKDLEHLKQLNAKLEDDLQKRQMDEKRLFLKSLRQEQRSRREMYRRSLYIVPNNTTPASLHLSADDEKRKLKDFEEKEKDRFESETQRLSIRHLKQAEEYKITAENLVKDLEEEQVIIFKITSKFPLLS
jgi:STE20-like kinase